MKSAYPQTQNPVSIRLYANIPFDNTYEHHSLISEWFRYNGSKIYDKAGVTACESFIDRKKYALTPNPPFYYPRWDMTDTYNFDFQNGLVGSVTLELTPEQTNANYMRVTCGSDVYYYFITGIKQVNFETYTLTLELDVLMTYQDEFLEGVKDIPMMTDRKHCHRYDSTGIYPACADLKTGDDVFAGVKPSIITRNSALKFSNSNIAQLRNIVWLYICCDAIKEENFTIISSIDGKSYPMLMLCLPLNVEYIVYYASDGVTELARFTKDDIKNCIARYLVGSGVMHGAKISYSPPFSSGNVTLENDLGIKVVVSSSSVYQGIFYKITIGENDFLIREDDTGSQSDFMHFMGNGGIALLDYHSADFQYEPDTSLVFKNNQSPSITQNRFTDPKLLFNPFKKYVLNASYVGEGQEIYPELLYSEYVLSNDPSFVFHSIFSAYIGDDNYYTYLDEITIPSQGTAFEGYKQNKIGLCGVVNYTLPVGTNALDVFNATQKASFVQSKIAGGISSAIQIGGGIASIAIGSGMTAVSGGGLSPMGMAMIAGGATAIGSGIAGGVDAIKSSVAKYEDLKNTPDSLNISGTSFTTDENVMRGKFKQPFITEYECASVIKEKANDYFYNYGYQVARDCYFNVELAYTPTMKQCDNNIFGRTIFNYVKINEDITNKINANIPQVIKQKLSQVFNKGITLWSFFGCDALWNDNNLTALNDPDLWFMKHTLDNTEYQG